jgi:Family of unknown function (DUF6161)
VSEEFPAFPVSINIDAKTTLSFEGPEELSEFCNKELSSWDCLKNSDYNHNGRAYDQIRSPVERVSQVITSYRQSPQDSHLINQLRSSAATLSNNFSEGHLVYSQTPLGKFIQSLALDDYNVAAAVYIFATRGRNENINFTKTSGLAFGHLSHFYAGISKRSANASVESIQAKSAEFSKIVLEADARSTELIEAINSRVTGFEKRSVEVAKQIATNVKTARRLFVRSRSELTSENAGTLSNIIGETRKEIDEFKDFIKKQIALQGPTDYWEAKRWWHRLSTGLTGLAFLVYLGACGWLISSTFWSRYESLFDFLDQWREAGIGAVALIGGILAVALMLARVLYRLFASQLHLWNDASERVTMIQTYLALAEKGHAKEEFLGALLNRLFTPATDGIVRDDLGSIGPIDLATRFTGSRQ